MKKFKVTTEHTVYEDSYENGQGEYVNSFTIESDQSAENSVEAVKKHYENKLYYSDFKIENAEFEDDEDNLHYSNLVDEDNYEATKEQINKWKKNKLRLYSNTMVFTVYELIKQTFE